MNLKVQIATVVTLVKTTDRHFFGSNREEGYVDQHTATGRDAMRNVTSTAAVQIYGGIAAQAGTTKALSTANISPSAA